MDERFIEQAGELAETQNATGVAACSKLAIPSDDLEPEQYKSLDCIECEEPLPDFRVKKGLELCVSCQSVKERARKR